MECLLEEYLQMIKGSSNLDGPRSIDVFYHFPYLEISGPRVYRAVILCLAFTAFLKELVKMGIPVDENLY